MTYNTTRKCCYAGYFVQAVNINFLPLLFVIFQEQFKLSYAQIGTLVSLNFGVQIVVDILSVFIVDKVGFRISAILSQLLSASGLMLLPVLASCMDAHFLGIVIATSLYSIGAGLIEIVNNPIIATLPKDENESGNKLIILHSFYCWGQLLTVLISTLALRIFGESSWGYISVFWGLVPFINGLFFFKTPIMPPQLTEKNKNVGVLLKNKTFIVILVLMICAGGSELAMAQWASAFAQKALGVDKIVGDLLGPCLFALFMGIGRTVHGLYGEKLNFRLNMCINCVLCALCYAVAVFSKNAYVALAGCSLCGYAISIMWPGVVSLSADKVGGGSGSAYSVIAIFGDIGCSLATFITGVIATMPIWGSNGLKAGLFVNIVFPIVFLFAFLKLTQKKRSIS